MPRVFVTRCPHCLLVPRTPMACLMNYSFFPQTRNASQLTRTSSHTWNHSSFLRRLDSAETTCGRRRCILLFEKHTLLSMTMMLSQPVIVWCRFVFAASIIRRKLTVVQMLMRDEPDSQQEVKED